MSELSGEEYVGVERRKRSRGGEWHRNSQGMWEIGWKKSSNGHLLMIAKSKCGRWWFKWIDGKTQGMVTTLGLAKRELEALALEPKTKVWEDLSVLGVEVGLLSPLSL